MDKKELCCICLTAKKLVYNIVNTAKQVWYEELTELKIEAVSFRICGICYRRLEQSSQMSQFAKQTQLPNDTLNMSSEDIKKMTSYSTLEISHTLNNDYQTLEEVELDKKPDIIIVPIKYEIKIEEEKYESDNSEMYKETEGKFDEVPEEIDKVNDSGKQKFTCDICKVNYELKDSMRRHIVRKHLSKKKVTGKNNDQISSELIHRREKEREFVCDICGRSFSSHRSRTIHLRTHTGERPYECDVCRDRFSHRATLDRHYRRHTRERPYVCVICSRGFFDSGALRTHMRCHTGEKPYACDVCDASFTTRSSMKAHRSRHTGRSLSACEICGKRYSLRYLLKRHYRVHTGEKPFACDMCGSRYTEKWYLRDHIRKVHEAVKQTHPPELACHICSRTFAKRRALDSHLTIHNMFMYNK